MLGNPPFFPFPFPFHFFFWFLLSFLIFLSSSMNSFSSLPFSSLLLYFFAFFSFPCYFSFIFLLPNELFSFLIFYFIFLIFSFAFLFLFLIYFCSFSLLLFFFLSFWSILDRLVEGGSFLPLSSCYLCAFHFSFLFLNSFIPFYCSILHVANSEPHLQVNHILLAMCHCNTHFQTHFIQTISNM